MLSLLLQSPIVVIIALLSLTLLFSTAMPAAKAPAIRLLVLSASLTALVVGLFAAVALNKSIAGFQFLSRINLIPEYNLSFTLGVDGLSLIFILLTLFIFPLCFLAA